MPSSHQRPAPGSYAPCVGDPPPSDIPVHLPTTSEMFTFPDLSTLLGSKERVLLGAVTSFALCCGSWMAWSAVRTRLEKSRTEEQNLEDESEIGTRAGAGETTTVLDSDNSSTDVKEAKGEMSKIRVSQLLIYPIKACAPVAIDSARVTDRGLENDRLFMVVDHTGRSVTQKKRPRLTLVRPSFDEGGRLYLEAPGMEPFVHSVKKWGTKQSVTHLTATCDAIDQGDDIAEFFVSFLGVPGLRLVRMREGFVRKIENKYVKPGQFQTSFSDAYPFLLVSEASLGQVSEKTGKDLEVTRFRPNIVVTGEGLKPFQEDEWKKLSIGERASFEIPKSCIRCKVVTVDPSTGVMDEKNQPTEALKSFRAFRKAVVFGQNMVPIHRHRLVHVKIGDEVVITETQEAPVPDCAGSDNKAKAAGESSGA